MLSFSFSFGFSRAGISHPVQFVVNKGGVIKVETYKGKNVSLYSMRIKNNSNMQILQTDTDAFKLKFLNGVDVGKAFVWYNLNSVSLSTNGDLLFDYDDDHTKKNVSIDKIVN